MQVQFFVVNIHPNHLEIMHQVQTTHFQQQAAKTYSGLSVKDFGKTITFQTATPEGFMNLAPTVKILARS